MKNEKLKIWEASLLIAVCVTLCCGVRLSARQTALEENLIRLHVVGADDTADEQSLKLRVRDAARQSLEAVLAGCGSAAEARRAIAEALPEIEAASRAASEGKAVKAAFGTESFPAREGDGYSLPAGSYYCLRVTIGEGRGHNWWGVIFPQLTLDAVSDTLDAVSALDDDSLALIEGGEKEYEIRFKLLEWLEKAREIF